MKKLILILMIFCMIGLISAAIPVLGTFKQSNDIPLRQTCTINGTFCDFCNLSSVDYPNGSRAISNAIMTKREGDFNFTLLSNFTGTVGEHRVNGYCGFGSDVLKNFVYFVDVTVSGTKLSTSGGIIYLIVLGILLFLFCLSLGGAIFIPYTNKSNEEGRIIDVNNLKYVKILLWVSAYLLLIGISFVSWGLTLNFLFLTGLSGYFKMIFWTLLAGLLPLFIVTLLTFITNFITDKKIHKALVRGLPLR